MGKVKATWLRLGFAFSAFLAAWRSFPRPPAPRRDLHADMARVLAHLEGRRPTSEVTHSGLLAPVDGDAPESVAKGSRIIKSVLGYPAPVTTEFKTPLAASREWAREIQNEMVTEAVLVLDGRVRGRHPR
jgi:hypothetical protein